MVSVKLVKPWLQYAIGDTVEVDPMRAEWLRANGYEEYVGEVVKPPRVGPGDYELRPLEPELPSPRPLRELKIQPDFLPLAVTETQIEDAGDGPAMVETFVRRSTKNKREPEG